jgi:hypothetical protein
MSPGFAGIDNELYYMDKTLMLFGDAKAFVGQIDSARSDRAGDGSGRSRCSGVGKRRHRAGGEAGRQRREAQNRRTHGSIRQEALSPKPATNLNILAPSEPTSLHFARGLIRVLASLQLLH